MNTESYNELLVTHKQILVELKEITKDHESRLRILERVSYSAITIVAIVQIAFGKFNFK